MIDILFTNETSGADSDLSGLIQCKTCKHCGAFSCPFSVTKDTAGERDYCSHAELKERK